ncbi:hypothetical protein tb265_17360 [Gemmatimonadetes bacterium T265]|nr:hypothetical protein tb265_17360 [Gemmatimonadetes bacterium T265]
MGRECGGRAYGGGTCRGRALWSIGHTRAPLDRMRSSDAADSVTPGGLGPDDPTPDDATAYTSLRTWVAARDAVLRGLVHALSNRVGTVVAAGGMLEAGSAEVAGRVLGGEAERLEALLAQFRLATADPFGDAAAPEPLLLAEVVGEAVALHGYADAAGEGAVALARVGEAPPVFVSRVGLLHALLVLLADAGGGTTTLRADVGGAGVVDVRTDPPPGGAGASAAAWLLRASGVRAAGGALTLPQLGAERAR